MQTANVMVRLAGSLENTVPKLGITPAEILVLQHIHGSDAVVDIRPAGETKRRHDEEYARLSSIYDQGAGAFHGAAGDEDDRGVMAKLFPGAMKRLPETLADIGIGTGFAAAAPEPEPVADLPDTDTDDEELSAGEAGDAGEPQAASEEAGEPASTTDAE